MALRIEALQGFGQRLDRSIGSGIIDASRAVNDAFHNRKTLAHHGRCLGTKPIRDEGNISCVVEKFGEDPPVFAGGVIARATTIFKPREALEFNGKRISTTEEGESVFGVTLKPGRKPVKSPVGS